MECKLVFLLLLVCAAYTAGQDGFSDSSDSSKSSGSGEDSGSGSSSDGSSGGDSSSGSSEKSEKTQPCSTDDMECIRDYFASSNLCTKTSHEDGDVVEREQQVAYLPKFNCTFICLDNSITFIGSSIETFYVNQKSNNLVMTVNFEGINIYTSRANFVLHLRGEEPKVVKDFSNITYTCALTAIIPHKGLRGVAGAAVSAYNTDAMPPFEIGPKISDSSDEEVSIVYNALIEKIPTAVQELLMTKASYFFFTYLQEYICDYGFEFTAEAMY